MSYCDDEGISQLGRKQKFVGTSIEVLMHEMHKLMTDEKSQRRLDKALERLNSLEKEYSRIVQELIAILPNEESVNDEVRKWALFQQEILEITMLAEQQISLQTEDTKRQFSTTSPSNPNYVE